MSAGIGEQKFREETLGLTSTRAVLCSVPWYHYNCAIFLPVISMILLSLNKRVQKHSQAINTDIVWLNMLIVILGRKVNVRLQTPVRSILFVWTCSPLLTCSVNSWHTFAEDSGGWYWVTSPLYTASPFTFLCVVKVTPYLRRYFVKVRDEKNYCT